MEKIRNTSLMISLVIIAAFVLRGTLGLLSYTVHRISGLCVLIGAAVLMYQFRKGGK